MNTIHLKPSDPAVREILQAAYPGFTGREVTVSIHNQGGMPLTSCWSGGSRDVHYVLELATMKSSRVPENGNGFTAVDRAYGPAGLPLELPAPGYAVVTHHEGAWHGLTIHIHADNARTLLPAPCEITWAEKVVLVATRSLKSSYAGIKDYRFVEAQRETGITREQWDAAKTGLIERRLLNAAGAITTEGRNAAGCGDLYSLRQKAQVA